MQVSVKCQSNIYKACVFFAELSIACVAETFDWMLLWLASSIVCKVQNENIHKVDGIQKGEGPGMMVGWESRCRGGFHPRSVLTARQTGGCCRRYRAIVRRARCDGAPIARDLTGRTWLGAIPSHRWQAGDPGRSYRPPAQHQW